MVAKDIPLPNIIEPTPAKKSSVVNESIVETPQLKTMQKILTSREEKDERSMLTNSTIKDSPVSKPTQIEHYSLPKQKPS